MLLDLKDRPAWLVLLGVKGRLVRRVRLVHKGRLDLKDRPAWLVLLGVKVLLVPKD